MPGAQGEPETKHEKPPSGGRFGGLFDNDFRPTLLTDPATSKIIDANRAACRFYGCIRAQFARLRKMNVTQTCVRALTARCRNAANSERPSSV